MNKKKGSKVRYERRGKDKKEGIERKAVERLSQGWLLREEPRQKKGQGEMEKVSKERYESKG